MRSTVVLATLGALALLPGCNSKSAAPSVDPPASPGLPAVHATTTHDQLAPVSIVYTSIVPQQPREIHAVLEDGSRAPVRLSRQRTESSFAGVMPGKRVLVAAHAEDGSIVAIDSVRADGEERHELGALQKGTWAKVVHAKVDGDSITVEMSRLDAGSISDVVTLRKGAAPVTIAQASKLVSAASGRVAYLRAGSLESAKSDGTDVRPLGGGDGQDNVIEAHGDRLLVTLHTDAAGDVRIVSLDGSQRVDIGTPAVDDRAFGFAGNDKVVFSRLLGATHRLFVTGLDGKGEQPLTAPEADATAAAVTPAGDVLFTTPQGLFEIALAGGAAKLLDPSSGATIRVAKVDADRAFYTGGEGNVLRTAKLDGSGANDLCNQALWIPFFSTTTPDGRAVFYRALSGQLEGGKLYSVKLDGTDLEPVGDDVVDPNGKAYPGVPADQDYEAVTPSGRVVLEAEFEGVASHLLVSAGGVGAQRITDQEHVKFAALTIE